MDDRTMSDDESSFLGERALTRIRNIYTERTFKNMSFNEWMFYNSGGMSKIRAMFYKMGLIKPLIDIVESYMWNGEGLLYITQKDIEYEIAKERNI